MIFAIFNAAGFTSVSPMMFGLPCFVIRYATLDDAVWIGLSMVRKMRAARKALRGAVERPGGGVPRWRRRSYLSVSVKTEKHTLAFSLHSSSSCLPIDWLARN
ncbi:unnamed protein product [Pleuronectes platessa]|uniref:Uncharacterized protein n=1 Tax=Pleuronectes platessa TaxID=8262 RepID=A0A9N7YD93_PLEPL|nr:unnamed protein product [Pleuronectes platessa]